MPMSPNSVLAVIRFENIGIQSSIYSENIVSLRLERNSLVYRLSNEGDRSTFVFCIGSVELIKLRVQQTSLDYLFTCAFGCLGHFVWMRR